MPLEFSFDAASALGIGTPSSEPLPAPEAGFTIIRIPDGLSLQALRDSHVGQRLMNRQDWYDKYQWSREALPAGVYRLCIPVPGSNHKTFAVQQAMLPDAEQVAPVVLVVIAILCIRQGVIHPLRGAWIRCAEQSADGQHVVLAWYDDRLGINEFCDGGCYSSVWASSVRV
jgi:hypothetical protein